ncbi:MAG: FtsX-like permease family protein, partial [Longimicrobiales bacterium]
IGVRIALGAAPRAVRGLVLRQGVRLTALGLVIGAAGASGLVRLLGSLLHDLTPYDPLAFGAATAAIGAAALLASWLPASRASTVDPLTAVRSE